MVRKEDLSFPWGKALDSDVVKIIGPPLSYETSECVIVTSFLAPFCPSRSWVSRSFLAVMLAALLGLWSSLALAGAGAWAVNDQSRVRLIIAPSAVGDGELVKAGLEIELNDGWKTYWRSPGDAGYPVKVKWDGSENLAEAKMAWPVPKRFTLFGLETFGYSKRVVFPLALKVEDPSQPLSLRGEINYLVCAELCVPQREEVAISLPSGPAQSTGEAYTLDQFRARVPDVVAPGETASSGLTIDQVTMVETEAGLTLEATLRSALPLSEPDLMVEEVKDYRFGKPEVLMAADSMTALLRLPVTTGPRAKAGFPFGEKARLTFVDGERGLEESVGLELGAASVAFANVALRGSGAGTGDATGLFSSFSGGGSSLATRSFFVFIGLALLGGLILNLMPCVLPVLSLKVLSAVGHGGKEKKHVRLSYLASAAGILTSFVALALLAIGLKLAGLNVGWGIQFQQPLFLAAMALLVTLFACNMFGFFEVRLPSWLSTAASRDGAKDSLWGDFGTGAFATLLATPCSAPFLGTAVGFALARGPVEILAIFLALGVGLALPYLLMALWPGLATRLPKPGAWMVTLRNILGLALAGTAVWLLSVLWGQIGLWGTLALAMVLLLLGAVFFLKHHAILHRPMAGLAVGLLVVLSLSVPGLTEAFVPAGLGQKSGKALAASDNWSELEPAKISQYVAQGKVVFVDITADWCITCQVNKALVLEREPVITLLNQENIVLMRGDWTSPDEKISAFLASYGRYGIPFNAVFGPQQTEGVLLPEFLSIDGTVAALDQADGGNRLASLDP